MMLRCSDKWEVIMVRGIPFDLNAINMAHINDSNVV
jgi:hypothetical protein